MHGAALRLYSFFIIPVGLERGCIMQLFQRCPRAGLCAPPAVLSFVWCVVAQQRTLCGSGHPQRLCHEARCTNSWPCGSTAWGSRCGAGLFGYI